MHRLCRGGVTSTMAAKGLTATIDADGGVTSTICATLCLALPYYAILFPMSVTHPKNIGNRELRAPRSPSLPSKLGPSLPREPPKPQHPFGPCQMPLTLSEPCPNSLQEPQHLSHPIQAPSKLSNTLRNHFFSSRTHQSPPPPPRTLSERIPECPEPRAPILLKY